MLRRLRATVRVECLPSPYNGSSTLIQQWTMRHFSSKTPSTSAESEPVYGVAPGEDVSELQRNLMGLLRPRWKLSADGTGIEREFHFKTWKKTWCFMTAVGTLAGDQNHHPEWSNVYNKVFIRWTTHRPYRGLTLRDVEMAQLCDLHAAQLGEVRPLTEDEKGLESKREA